MAKLKFSINNQEFEVEGSQEEIVEIIQRMTRRQNREIDHIIPRSQNPNASPLSQKIPTVEQVILYILSKPPKFEHDISTVSSHFLNEKITSRKNPHEYRKMSLLLQNARKIIEHQKQGKFEQLPTPEKNLKKYVFKSLTKSLEETFVIKSGQLQGDGAASLDDVTFHSMDEIKDADKA